MEGKKYFIVLSLQASLEKKIITELLKTIKASKLNMLQAEMPFQALLHLHK